MAGIVALRRQLHFDLPDLSCDAFTLLIILKLAGRTIGIVIDSVSDGMRLRDLPI